MTHPQNLPRLATLAAVALLVLTIGWHAQRLIAGRSSDGATAGTSAPATPPAAPPADLTALGEWQPYGAAATVPSAASETAVVAPSPLNIQLRGTVAGASGETGEAIIADETGAERAYSIGEKIVDGAVLHAIRERDVVIKRGEQLESVALPMNPSAGGGDAPPLPEATNIPGMTAAPEPMLESPPEPAPAPEPPMTGAEGQPGNPAIPVPPPPDMTAIPPAEALPPGNE